MSDILFEGPKAFVDLGKRALDKCNTRWPELIKADVGISYVNQIPGAPEWAEGLYRGAARHGFVRTQYRRDGAPKQNITEYLTLHEGVGHPSDQDRMQGHRGKARALMHPRPDGWRDTDGVTGIAGYWRLPFETYANRLVEALTQGEVRSPYDDDYVRWIPNRDLPTLLKIPLQGSEFVAFAVDPDTATDTMPEGDIVEPPPDIRLVEALERLRRIKRITQGAIDVLTEET